MTGKVAEIKVTMICTCVTHLQL